MLFETETKTIEISKSLSIVLTELDYETKNKLKWTINDHISHHDGSLDAAEKFNATNTAIIKQSATSFISNGETHEADDETVMRFLRKVHPDVLLKILMTLVTLGDLSEDETKN